MNKGLQNRWLVAWAILGAPLLYSAAIHVSYELASASNQLPFNSTLGVFTAYAILGVCIGSGLVSLWRVSFARMSYRVVTCVAYSAAAVVGSFFIALLVACSHGDCL